MPVSQSAKSILMISPASFGFDLETAESNTFQIKTEASQSSVIARAMKEFDQAVEKLRQANVDIVVYQGSSGDNRPNAVFPNNWISTWPDGSVFLYPMATKSRRGERDQRVLDQISEEFAISKTTDLSASEKAKKYLESTGVMIFDHLNRIVYGCISARCDQQLFTDHAKNLGYQPVTFHSYDQSGVPIYHTNVMMGIQSTTAVICSRSITDEVERTNVLKLLGKNRKVVDITPEQMLSFCGNILEVTNKFDEKILVLSRSALNAFTGEQLDILSADKTLLPLDIPTIEKIGGGSARCMLAEIFLPKIAN